MSASTVASTHRLTLLFPVGIYQVDGKWVTVKDQGWRVILGKAYFWKQG